MLYPYSGILLSNVITCKNFKNMLRERRQTKGYIVCDSLHEGLELIPGDRHKKVVVWGLGGGSEFTRVTVGHKATFWVKEMFCILIWGEVT